MGLNTTNFLHYFNVSSNGKSLAIPSSIVIWSSTTLTICFIGCINNFIVLYLVWPRARVKATVNLLILHFVFANLLMVGLHFPIRCLMVLAKHLGYAVPLHCCRYVQSINFINWLVIYWCDASLAVNRCVALYFPHRYNWYSTTRKNVLQIVLGWILSAAFVLPGNFGLGTSVMVTTAGHCAMRLNSSWYAVFFELIFVAQLGVTGVASILVLIKCYKMSRVNGMLLKTSFGMERISSSVRMRMNQRIRLAQLLVLTYVCSILCTFPSLLIIRKFPWIFEEHPWLHLWLQTWVVAQYAITPSILLFSNVNLRERLSDRQRHRNRRNSTLSRRRMTPSDIITWSQP